MGHRVFILWYRILSGTPFFPFSSDSVFSAYDCDHYGVTEGRLQKEDDLSTGSSGAPRHSSRNSDWTEVRDQKGATVLANSTTIDSREG